MAVLRENNWLGQQRLDIPQLRSMESSVRGDFDLVVGTIFAGKLPVIVRGFALTQTSVGSPASSIQVVVANSISTNFYATESGSMFVVPSDRANEQLTSLNAKVIGSFTANATNYVGMDIRRAADATTSDILQFLNATTLLETGRTVPLARTLDYRFIISTTDFASQPNLCPIAKVVTDSSNNISSIVDARQLAFRLAPGGSFASAFGGYSWANGRSESVTALDMSSGDKSILSTYDWMKAAMTRIQEVGGGEFWYSATADRNVTMVWTGATFLNGENFEWSGNNLHWKGLRFIFDNSHGTYNEVVNQTSNSVGLTDLVDGECIYVDLDRTQNRSGGTALVAAKAMLSTLGPGSIPGARQIIAWRSGTAGLTLDYNTQTVNFVGGSVNTLTGVTSGATALIVSDVDAGATGTLTLTNLTGTFIPGEIITSTPGSATAGLVMTTVYTRNWRYPVGTIWIPATTAATGVVRISRDYAGVVTAGLSKLNVPVAISDRGGIITCVAGTNHSGLVITPDGLGHGISVANSGTAPSSTAITATATGVSSIAISATTTGGAVGIVGIGPIGIQGFSNQNSGVGGDFYSALTPGGFATGIALRGTSYSTNGDGVQGIAAGTGTGVQGTGGATGAGVKGFGGGSGSGGEFAAGATGVGLKASATAGDSIQATGGDISLGSAFTYKYSGAVTRHIIRSISEATFVNGTYTNVAALFPIIIPSDAGTFRANIQLNVPSGAIITAVEILAGNQDNVGRQISNIYILKGTRVGGGNYSSLYANNAGAGFDTITMSTLAAAPGLWWSIPMIGTAANRTADDDSFFTLGFGITSNISTTVAVSIAAVRVTYTQTEVRGAQA